MNIITDINFLDFRVAKLDFCVNDNPSHAKQATVRTEFKVRHECKGNRLKVHLTIFFKDKDAPFSIHLEGVGLFELHRSFTEAEIEELSHSHCATMMFPYMRETIADISRRAGFPPLHIPQIDFNQVFKQQLSPANIHTLH
ncbi:MAG: protein-export chaperone SecB [Desulfuromonas sp.]|nr:protein-export chaperone SecB [Desulfuromonas sp.]